MCTSRSRKISVENHCHSGDMTDLKMWQLSRQFQDIRTEDHSHPEDKQNFICYKKK